jgi:hypothetical protein
MIYDSRCGRSKQVVDPAVAVRADDDESRPFVDGRFAHCLPRSAQGDASSAKELGWNLPTSQVRHRSPS